MSTNTDASTSDWLRSPTTSLLAWWGPQTAIVAKVRAFLDVVERAFPERVFVAPG